LTKKESPQCYNNGTQKVQVFPAPKKTLLADVRCQDGESMEPQEILKGKRKVDDQAARIGPTPMYVAMYMINITATMKRMNRTKKKGGGEPLRTKLETFRGKSRGEDLQRGFNPFLLTVY
jgi:hypothetical protein